MTEATPTTTDRSNATALIYDWRPAPQVPRVPTEAVTLSLPQWALHCLRSELPQLGRHS